METPFSRRMKEFAEQNKTEVKAYSPVQGKEPAVGEGRAPLMGDIRTQDPAKLADEAEKKQMTSVLEGSRGQVQEAANALRQKVASGELSMADAEHQMDLLTNKLTDNSYMGYGDLDMRRRAAGFGDKAEQAYGMYGMGLDPELMARERDRMEAEKGVLSDVENTGGM